MPNQTSAVTKINLLLFEFPPHHIRRLQLRPVNAAPTSGCCGHTYFTLTSADKWDVSLQGVVFQDEVTLNTEKNKVCSRAQPR